MAVRQYIGARYVPIFGRKDEESIQWDNTKPYEPLTIVLHQGNSYTSRQYVPIGIDIANQEFWALTGNYNAQIEAYRSEVQALDGRILENAQAIGNLETDLETETDNRENADIAINARIDGIETNGWVTTDRIGEGAVTSDKINQDVIQYLMEPINELAEKIEAITTVQNNWITSNYQTSYWGYKIPKSLFSLKIANCNGSQIYSVGQKNVVDFMLTHPEAVLGHNCDFGSATGTRPTRINGVNYNTTEPAHYYPLLAVNPETNEIEMFPSYTDVSNIPQKYTYAFSISHQLIENGIPGSNFPTYTDYDWNNTYAPRIGFGEDEDYFYGLFCEGRGKCERGMTLPEFAALFASIWHPVNAYNFDGGGSIYMVTNVPSTTKINRMKDFEMKFNELRTNMLCWYYVEKEG